MNEVEFRDHCIVFAALALSLASYYNVHLAHKKYRMNEKIKIKSYEWKTCSAMLSRKPTHTYWLWPFIFFALSSSFFIFVGTYVATLIYE